MYTKIEKRDVGCFWKVLDDDNQILDAGYAGTPEHGHKEANEAMLKRMQRNTSAIENDGDDLYLSEIGVSQFGD